MTLTFKSLDPQVEVVPLSDHSGVVCFHTQIGSHIIFPPEYFQLLQLLKGTISHKESDNDLEELFCADEIKYAVNTLEVNGFIIENGASQAVGT